MNSAIQPQHFKTFGGVAAANCNDSDGRSAGQGLGSALVMVVVVDSCEDDDGSGDVGNDDDGAYGVGGYEGLTLFMVLSVVCCL